jgi:phosphatidylglycerol:prolipoprotein diacylglycerol transferase
MVFPTDPEQVPRHPSQLYEAGLEGLLLFIILFVWYSARPRPRGAVCSLFVLLYGCFRFFVEFYRQPDAHINFARPGIVFADDIYRRRRIYLGAYQCPKKPAATGEINHAAVS